MTENPPTEKDYDLFAKSVGLQKGWVDGHLFFELNDYKAITRVYKHHWKDYCMNNNLLNENDVSVCPGCHCMTKTVRVSDVGFRCGKCKCYKKRTSNQKESIVNL